MMAAAEGGHLPVLHWLQQQPSFNLQAMRREWKQAVESACQYGRVDVLQWLVEGQEQPYLDENKYKQHCTYAAEGGHIRVLTYLREHGWERFFHNREVMEAAAGAGQLETVQWLRSLDPPCPWNKNLCQAAARSGRKDLLQFLRQQQPPCPWDITKVAAAAAGNGYVNILEWLKENNHFLLAQARPRVAAARTLLPVAVAEAALEEGHLPVLQFLQESMFVLQRKSPLPRWLKPDAMSKWTALLQTWARQGELEGLQWLASQPALAECYGDKLWGKSVPKAAAASGQLEVLQWLVYGKSPPCPWDPAKCMEDASRQILQNVGHAAVVSWIKHVMAT
jgi:hypothetical protein